MTEIELAAPALIPDNEAERLEVLHSCCIVDTPPEKLFDDLTRLAARFFKVPIVFISLVDEDHQFLKSVVGISVRQTSRSVSFCQYGLLSDKPMIVLDTHKDDRFRNSPFVTREPFIRFYAGASLLVEGVKLGSFCLMDVEPHENFSVDLYRDLEMFAGLASDLIERRLLPEALQQAKQDNVSLQQKSMDEIAANRAKTEFLRNMSHEIRTPMNGVLGMIQLLLGTPLSTEQMHYAEVAQSSGNVMLCLLNDILDLSKIEAGMTTIEEIDFNLFNTLHDVVELWRLQAATKAIDFALCLSSKLPMDLRGDPARIRQVLNNLLSNAIKFTARGGVTLTVDLLAEDDRSATLQFAVKDTGIGMNAENLTKLFQPFVQADSSTTRKFGGTGLGLAISKHFVELMQGNIWIESHEGEGSTFNFTVVLDRAEGKPIPLVDLSERSSFLGEPSAHTSTKRVLVAEDNPTNQLVVMAQLKKLGFRADAVANGREAVEASQRESYDVILMDCEMPVMTGYEATRRIRELGLRIPIIALTAHAMMGNREDCIAAGMDYFLSKPIDIWRLGKTLDSLCRNPECTKPLESVVATDGLPFKVSPDIFEPESLMMRLMNDRAIADVVIQGFLSDCPQQLDRLKEKIDAADQAGIRLVAHGLKGAAATVSAGKLSAINREMETGSDQISRCTELHAEAVAAFSEFKGALKTMGWL